VIECIDAQRRPFAEVFDRLIRERDVVHIGQERVVDLQIQPGIDDGGVFLAQSVGKREKELLVGLVELVLVARHRARGGNDRQKSGGDFHRRECRLEIVDVAPDRGLSLVGQRRDRNDYATLGQVLGVKILGVEFRKGSLILAGTGGGRDLALLDPAEPLQHIG
jgi:hypothetical protein